MRHRNELLFSCLRKIFGGGEQVSGSVKRTATDTSQVFLVSVTIAPLSERLIAVFASERTSSIMRAHMVFDIANLGERLFASEALEHLIPPACLFVYSANFSPSFVFRDTTFGQSYDCRLLAGWHSLVLFLCHGLRLQGYSAQVCLITICVFLVYLGLKKFRL